MEIDNNFHQKRNGKFFSRETSFDKVCFKLIKTIYTGEECGEIYKTPFVGMNILPEKEYQTVMFENYTHLDNILYGFHSFENYDDAIKYNNDLNLGCTVFKAIIPRGSKYYCCKTGIYESNGYRFVPKYKNDVLVSNRIIIKEKI